LPTTHPGPRSGIQSNTACSVRSQRTGPVVRSTASRRCSTSSAPPPPARASRSMPTLSISDTRRVPRSPTPRCASCPSHRTTRYPGGTTRSHRRRPEIKDLFLRGPLPFAAAGSRAESRQGRKRSRPSARSGWRWQVGVRWGAWGVQGGEVPLVPRAG
jgi:hypothetical protein